MAAVNNVCVFCVCFLLVLQMLFSTFYWHLFCKLYPKINANEKNDVLVSEGKKWIYNI